MRYVAFSITEEGMSIAGFPIVVVLWDRANFPPFRIKFLISRVFPSTMRACFVLSFKVAKIAPTSLLH